jgi:hypothetical protein
MNIEPFLFNILLSLVCFVWEFRREEILQKGRASGKLMDFAGDESF